MTDLSFQLYSARKFPPLDAVLGKLAALGYKQVEGFGGLYEDAEGLAASLKRHGLTMPTGHFGFDQLKDTDKGLKIAETLGVKTIYCPHISPESMEKSEAKWTAFAEDLARLAETYTAAGYGFGWHNHHFEFWPLDSGKLPMDIILGTGAKLEWEADVAWIVRGGEDPEKWFDKYGSRITAVHLKDLAPAGENADEDGWADVGFGTMGWDNLIKSVKAKTAAKYFVAEHDNPSDLDRFASRSMQTWNKW